jgi:glucose/arabinose dehydrogenase
MLSPAYFQQSSGLILSLFGLALLLALAVRAAEPEVDPKELPRVPPTEPDKALATFKVKPGFRIELMAAEPLVVDPVAMSFDENGRLFVVEMRDYSERRAERLGRIRWLEDTDGDGRFDKSTVYADDLGWPTAVICYGRVCERTGAPERARHAQQFPVGTGQSHPWRGQ